jgi:cell wall-associated NlpC family hydrolase
MSLLFLALTSAFAYEPQNGDIIFHTSLSPQSEDIQKGTKSRYSHVGIVYIQDGKAMVLEASKKVRLRSLHNWVNSGAHNNYTVMRTQIPLTKDQINKMKKVGNQFSGKPYDLKFEWNDDKMYCSELVWKVYKEGAGIEPNPPKKMDQYSFDEPSVRKTLEKRWKGNINWKETVVAPSDLAQSTLLAIVESTYSTQKQGHAK